MNGWDLTLFDDFLLDFFDSVSVLAIFVNANVATEISFLKIADGVKNVRGNRAYLVAVEVDGLQQRIELEKSSVKCSQLASGDPKLLEIWKWFEIALSDGDQAGVLDRNCLELREKVFNALGQEHQFG